MNPPTPLRVGVLGAGSLARVRAKAAVDSGLADVVAVGARRSERAADVASEFGAPLVRTDDLLAMDLDAVPHWFGAGTTRPVELLSLFGAQGERAHVSARTTPTHARD